MYYIDLFSEKEINERYFIVFYESFDCVFTQYEEDDIFKVEVIFNKKNDLEDFISFCSSAQISESNPIFSLVESSEIKIFDKTGSDNWIKFLSPVDVGSQFVVVPPWHSENKKNEIIINPSLAFGTGHHETTRSCLELLNRINSRLDFRINSVLDIGTGSGILSIFSSKVFQCEVVGLDIDVNAIDQACKNLELNSTDVNIRFELNEFESIEGCFDLIIANISIEYLLNKFYEISQRLNNNSLFLVSGFLFDSIKNLNVLLIETKFCIISMIHDNNWITMVLKKI
jgi:ribosomal protein L11 methyltransferase|tara:strand:- start:59645 stop:60499 length:855 start_codon:yes stop_codon:yes gene_type:complete